MIADPARQVLEASTAWWELITTIAGFVTAFLTVVAAGFSSWYFIQNRRIANGSLHHVAVAKRRRNLLEAAALVGRPLLPPLDLLPDPRRFFTSQGTDRFRPYSKENSLL